MAGLRKQYGQANLQAWAQKTDFRKLPDEGLDAFAKSLSSNNSRRLAFWRFSSSFELQTLMPYISDGPNVLQDVEENDKFLESIKSNAEEVSSYIKKLHGRMVPDLNTEFGKFRRTLEQEIGRR